MVLNLNGQLEVAQQSTQKQPFSIFKRESESKILQLLHISDLFSKPESLNEIQFGCIYVIYFIFSSFLISLFYIYTHNFIQYIHTHVFNTEMFQSLLSRTRDFKFFNEESFDGIKLVDLDRLLAVAEYIEVSANSQQLLSSSFEVC